MATRVDTSFDRYQFSEEEEKAAATFTLLNTLYLKNKLATFAEEKLLIRYDPVNPMEFTQREAELQGQILLLQELIQVSEENERSRISKS